MSYFKKFKEFLKEKFGVSIPEWHSIVIGAGTAVVAGPGLFGAVITTALAVKSKSGHLADLRKELGYGLATFAVVEYVPQALQVIL